MKILITGINGFVGTHLAEYLVQKSYEIHGLIRTPLLSKPLEPLASKIKWIEGDIRDVSNCLTDTYDFVIHAASIVSFHQKDDHLMMDVNINGTKEIAQYCLDKGCKLIHMSSIATLGRSFLGASVDESSLWDEKDSKSAYSKSKFLAELEVQRAMEEGLQAIILHPGIILGEYARPEGTMKIFTAIQKGLRWYPIGSSGFVDVLDVVRFVDITIQSFDSLPFKNYLIVGFNERFKTLFERIALLMKIKAPHVPIEGKLKSLIVFLAGCQEQLGMKPFVNRNSILSGSHNTHYDNGRSLQHFTYTPSDNTLERIVTSLKE